MLLLETSYPYYPGPPHLPCWKRRILVQTVGIPLELFTRPHPHTLQLELRTRKDLRGTGPRPRTSLLNQVVRISRHPRTPEFRPHHHQNRHSALINSSRSKK